MGGWVGNWVWPKGENLPFSGRHKIPSDTMNCLFPSNTFLSNDILFFPNPPASKSLPEEEIFWGKDPLGAPEYCAWWYLLLKLTVEEFDHSVKRNLFITKKWYCQNVSLIKCMFDDRQIKFSFLWQNKSCKSWMIYTCIHCSCSCYSLRTHTCAG